VSKSKSIALLFSCLLCHSVSAFGRYAAIVIDANSGRVIHEIESTQRWYPASLTKVMTLYMTFSALELGRLNLDQMLTTSRHAASQPSSKLGLVTGQHISVENAIMAVTTRSANDAAVLLAEQLGGNESNFASMMTHQAHQLGMYASSFQNASGLPDEGQISSARDLALLSAALIRDFPQYYRFFSATQFNYKGRVLPNTNRILKSYPDADGLKTGFTCGSGYNLIASAKRNGQRVIGVLLGAHSSGERFQQMEDLLDVGFEKSRAGQFGMPVSELHSDNGSPPPFQLSSNRCAGSAEQMGADVGGSDHERVRIRSGTRHLAIASPDVTGASAGNWSVLLGDHSKKSDATVSLNKARHALGRSLSSHGLPQVVRQKSKGNRVWRAEWAGLDQGDANLFCKKLRLHNQDCTIFPGQRRNVSKHLKS